jgi:ankyrin repeat protein
MSAAYYNKEAAVDYLLSINVDINRQTSVSNYYERLTFYVPSIVCAACGCEQNGLTALHLTCLGGSLWGLGIAEKLIRAGADINLRDSVSTHLSHK